MAFEIPEGLNEELYPLAWMIGTWRGKGHGEYPGIEKFEFAQEVTFNHDGRDFLNYYSRTWLIDADANITAPFDLEVGFWHPRPKKVLEVVLAHNTGRGEGWVGIYDGPKIQLAMDRGYVSPSGKGIESASRLYGLVDGQLFYANDVEMNGHELQAYMWSTMERQSEI